ncbi:MAG: hypothetical protein K2G42_07590 [Clostridia bacterium]|nr:hypothetical protein [Clostridia bacterium]
MSDLNMEDEVLDTQDDLTLDDILGEDAGLDADMDLESQFNVQEEEEDFFIEDISGFAKGFPDWDLLPPTAKGKKASAK